MSPVKEGYFARVCLSGFQEEIATSDKLQPSLTLRVLTSVADRVYLALPTTIFKGTDQSDLRVLVAVAHCCTQGIAQATVAGIESTTEGRPELNPSVLSDEWVLHRFHSVCWSRKPSIARHRRRMSAWCCDRFPGGYHRACHVANGAPRFCCTRATIPKFLRSSTTK